MFDQLLMSIFYADSAGREDTFSHSLVLCHHHPDYW